MSVQYVEGKKKNTKCVQKINFGEDTAVLSGDQSYLNEEGTSSKASQPTVGMAISDRNVTAVLSTTNNTDQIDGSGTPLNFPIPSKLDAKPSKLDAKPMQGMTSTYNDQNHMSHENLAQSVMPGHYNFSQGNTLPHFQSP